MATQSYLLDSVYVRGITSTFFYSRFSALYQSGFLFTSTDSFSSNFVGWQPSISKPSSFGVSVSSQLYSDHFFLSLLFLVFLCEFSYLKFLSCPVATTENFLFGIFPAAEFGKTHLKFWICKLAIDVHISVYLEFNDEKNV